MEGALCGSNQQQSNDLRRKNMFRVVANDELTNFGGRIDSCTV